MNNYKFSEIGTTNIYIIEDFLDSQTCDNIIKLIDIIPKDKKVIDPNINNVECYSTRGLNKLAKLNDESFYKFNLNDHHPDINFNITNIHNGLKNSDIIDLIQFLNKKMESVVDLMEKKEIHVSFKFYTDYRLRKIYGGTCKHIDGLNILSSKDVQSISEKFPITDDCKYIRNASTIINLNDDFDGGVFHFTGLGLKFKPKKGTMLIFPPYWTHPHEVSPVANNKHRYTINSWFCDTIHLL